MSFILSAVRLLLLAVSFYGYVQWVSQKLRVEFSIGVVFCATGSALFFAGILNVLPEATATIFAYNLLCVHVQSLSPV